MELHIPATLLTGLATDPRPAGPWAAVIADLIARYTSYHAQSGGSSGDLVGPGKLRQGITIGRNTWVIAS